MPIKIAWTDPNIDHVDIDGERIFITYNDRQRSQGPFFATYRGGNISASTLEMIGNRVRRVRDDAAARARTAEMRKRAALKPLPGVAFLASYIERVGVRGRHATSREALVTYANGSKGSISPQHLMRDLTAEEFAEVEWAVEAHTDAQAALSGTQSPNRFTLEKEYDLSLDAHYDAPTDRWVLTYDGREFSGTSTMDLDAALSAYLLLRDYPFTVHQGEVVDLRTGEGERKGYWKTAEEARRYLDAAMHHGEAKAALEKLLAAYRFDLSPFAEQD